MAGHSKFKNIQHRKGAQDKKRAKVFTKLVRDIYTAAQSGDDPALNPKLRNAISVARVQNLPKDRIDKAIKQASDPSQKDNYAEVRYEGFAPGGVALIVEALTDNKNRTASHVRSTFTKGGGNLGETGNVSFMFDKLGMIKYKSEKATDEDMLEAAIEAGAEDVYSDSDEHIIYSAVEDFQQVLENLQEKYSYPEESSVGWRAQNHLTISDKEQADKLFKLIEMLEDSDDVQEVYGNFEID